MGIRMCCREITSRYDLPIVISENGLGAFDKFEDGKIHDPYRIDYLKRHIEELKKLAMTAAAYLLTVHGLIPTC